MMEPVVEPLTETDDRERETFQRLALGALDDVARFALALTRDAAAADDLVQDTYLRALRSRHTWRADGDMRRWLFTITKNAWLRDRERSAHATLRDGLLDGPPEEETLGAVRQHAALAASGSDELFDRIEVAPAIHTALGALIPEFRMVVVLVDLEGYNYADAAAALEVPVGTVRSRLFRARRLLQDALVTHARDFGIRTSPTLSTRNRA